MSIIKSSDDHLTFNADGTSKNILFQADGVQRASISSAGLLTSTTIDATVLTGNLPAISAASLTNIPAANITGTIAAVSGVNLTALNASNLGSGTVPTARLGSGTASSSTFLRGDSTYASAADATKLPLAGGTMTGTLVLPAGSGSTGGLNMPNVNSHITGSGHGVIQTDATMSYFYGGTDGVQFRTANNASRLVGIDNTGNVTLDSGDIVFGTAGKGICLGVTSNTDANTLDDYEEGTWTPTNNGGSVTITVNEANYTKIGRLVTVQAYLGIGGDGDGTEMRIGGLPFAAHNTTYESAIGRFSTYGDTANVYVSTTSGQTYLWVITKNTFLNENQIDGAGGDWNFSLTYHVN